MSAITASQLLRPGLLQGRSILLAGAPPAIGLHGSLAQAVAGACSRLGADVCHCPLGLLGDDGGTIEPAVAEAIADARDIELLVLDCAGIFAHACRRVAHNTYDPDDSDRDRSSAAREALRDCLDISWNVTRAVTDSAFLPNARGGRIVYLAPPADAARHADAARAGIENLARTLSIEWARHRITTVAIATGTASADQVAALTAYLASPAGAYFSGCLLDLSRACEERPIQGAGPGGLAAAGQ